MIFSGLRERRNIKLVQRVRFHYTVNHLVHRKLQYLFGTNECISIYRIIDLQAHEKEDTFNLFQKQGRTINPRPVQPKEFSYTTLKAGQWQCQIEKTGSHQVNNKA